MSEDNSDRTVVFAEGGIFSKEANLKLAERGVDMFEQIDDPEIAGRKTWKERLTEGAIILAVAAVVIGIILYAIEMG